MSITWVKKTDIQVYFYKVAPIKTTGNQNIIYHGHCNNHTENHRLEGL